MGVIIRLLFPLLAYLCVGTVITLGAGYGYLRHSGKLDDERMFRIVSLLHGIDLGEIAKAHANDQGDVPPEEISFDQRQEHLQVATLYLQAKKDDIDNQLNEFRTQFKQLDTAIGRYNELRDEIETFLEQQRNEVLESGIVSVRNQLQNLHPKKQAKPLLEQMIKEDRTDEVILLLNGMSARNRRDILLTFDDVEDIEVLYKIQQKMLAGDPEKSFIDSKLEELQQLRQQD